MFILKRIAAMLPAGLQNEIRRVRFASRIRRNRFASSEPEYGKIEEFVKRGDWALDIGANVGHYTKRLSDLAGPEGRVIALEPVATTFSLLAANTLLFTHRNVSLINAAASDRIEVVGMQIPESQAALPNYYEAHLVSGASADVRTLSLPVDSLGLENSPVSFVKIDAEGHEYFVLAGMRGLLEKRRPVLVVETRSDKVLKEFSALGYVPERIQDSPNVILRPE